MRNKRYGLKLMVLSTAFLMGAMPTIANASQPINIAEEIVVKPKDEKAENKKIEKTEDKSSEDKKDDKKADKKAEDQGVKLRNEKDEADKDFPRVSDAITNRVAEKIEANTNAVVNMKDQTIKLGEAIEPLSVELKNVDNHVITEDLGNFKNSFYQIDKISEDGKIEQTLLDQDFKYSLITRNFDEPTFKDVVNKYSALDKVMERDNPDYKGLVNAKIVKDGTSYKSVLFGVPKVAGKYRVRFVAEYNKGLGGDYQRTFVVSNDYTITVTSDQKATDKKDETKPSTPSVEKSLEDKKDSIGTIVTPGKEKAEKKSQDEIYNAKLKLKALFDNFSSSKVLTSYVDEVNKVLGNKDATFDQVNNLYNEIKEKLDNNIEKDESITKAPQENDKKNNSKEIVLEKVDENDTENPAGIEKRDTSNDKLENVKAREALKVLIDKYKNVKDDSVSKAIKEALAYVNDEASDTGSLKQKYTALDKVIKEYEKNNKGKSNTRSELITAMVKDYKDTERFTNIDTIKKAREVLKTVYTDKNKTDDELKKAKEQFEDLVKKTIKPDTLDKNGMRADYQKINRKTTRTKGGSDAAVTDADKSKVNSTEKAVGEDEAKPTGKTTEKQSPKTGQNIFKVLVGAGALALSSVFGYFLVKDRKAEKQKNK